MHSESIIFTIFLIFTGAAIFATFALYARQSLLVIYIFMGVLFGPSGFEFVTDPNLVKEIAHVGIIFLLFLLGLNMAPSRLINLIRQTLFITSVTSIMFALVGFAIAWIFRYSLADSIIIAVSLMFSSTIIGLKLLPTTVLHHRRTGEIIVSILLLQDFIAIFVLLAFQAGRNGQSPLIGVIVLVLSFVGMIVFIYIFNRFILLKLMTRFDRIHEYLFLMTIGWCLGIAVIADAIGLSYEIGAFMAGVALASSPIAMFISEVLKPLRDFFLIMFFFALGATFDLHMATQVFLPSLILALLILSIKPLIFRFLLTRAGEETDKSMEIGVRLGQSSEFSILIAVLALDLHILSQNAAYLIQVSTLITFIVSSYLITMKYYTPMAVSDKLRRD